jgi:XTP/dITP diphosphohydrolase
MTRVGTGSIDGVYCEVDVFTEEGAWNIQVIFFADDPKVGETLSQKIDDLLLTLTVGCGHPVGSTTSFGAFDLSLDVEAPCQCVIHGASARFSHDDPYDGAIDQCLRLSLHLSSLFPFKGRWSGRIACDNLYVNMKTLIFATHNTGKLTEMRQLLEGLDVKVLSAQEAGVMDDVVEDAETFEGNALKKARFVAEKTGEWSVADDSGVCIDALDGRPGVHTARWAGPDAGDDGLVRHTLEQMEGVPEGKRGAQFRTVAALVSPDGKEWVFEGFVAGQITKETHGTNRPKLPYDLIFQPDGENRTFAQMTDVEKNSLSHRGMAFGKFKEFLDNQGFLG